MFVSNLPIWSRVGMMEIKDTYDATAWWWQNERRSMNTRSAYVYGSIAMHSTEMSYQE